VSFSTGNPVSGDTVIANGISLVDGAATPLPLQPRIPGFDAGAVAAIDGSFSVGIFNFGEASIRLEDTTIRLLSRFASIDFLLAKPSGLIGPFAAPVTPWSTKKPFDASVRLLRGKSLRIPVARMRDARRAVRTIGPAQCNRGDMMRPGRDTKDCTQGESVGLFPATSTLISATVVDPLAKHWDRERRAYVIGPLRSRVAYQLAGRHPDLDKNGIDDYLDIKAGRARDSNGDGVPDHAQPRR
jgi:hypothetical protein